VCWCVQEVRKAGVAAQLQDDAVRGKFSLDMQLVAENKDDARVAQLMQFSTVDCEWSVSVASPLLATDPLTIGAVCICSTQPV